MLLLELTMKLIKQQILRAWSDGTNQLRYTLGKTLRATAEQSRERLTADLDFAGARIVILDTIDCAQRRNERKLTI